MRCVKSSRIAGVDSILDQYPPSPQNHMASDRVNAPVMEEDHLHEYAKHDKVILSHPLKKMSLITPSLLTAHQTFILGKSRICSRTSFGCSVAQMTQLCLFARPVMWNVASSENINRMSGSICSMCKKNT
ncbi:hypothetical protein Trydic_g1185 [Trypoxylus dichotomus]